MQLSGADADALKVNGYDWIKMAEAMRSSSVPVPRVISTLPSEAAIIVEDYGDMTVETEALRLMTDTNWSGLKDLYTRLIDLVGLMLRADRSGSEVWTTRAFDSEKLHWELDFFMRQFAVPIAGLNLTPAQNQQFEADAKSISAYLSQFSRYLTHRDFHSRNVMFKQGELAVIDFQDSRLGPPSYDLVSVLFDSYVPFELPLRTEFMNLAIARIGKSSSKSVADEIEMTWRPMLLQRQLKAIGSFGYLTRVKGRGNYLRYVKDALLTIPAQVVGDQRWPFISIELVKLLNQAAG